MPLQITPNNAAIAEGRAKVGGVAQYSIPGVQFRGVGTKTLTANRILYMPMQVVTPIVIDQLAIEVTTAGAAGKLARLAIYNADTDWQPTTRVVDAGTVAVDPGAPPTVTTASISTTLAAGRYLLAIISDGTPVLRSFQGGSPLGLLAALGASPIPFQIFIAGSGTTLPDPGTAWGTISGSGSNFDYVVLCRVSTP